MKFQIILAAVVFIFFTQTLIADSEETKRKVDHFEMVARTGIYDNVEYSKEDIRKAIVKTRGEDSNNPVSTSEAYLNALVDGFSMNAEKYKLPSILFVGMALKESEFLTTAEGTRGEKGILQVGRQGRRACAKECGEFSMDPGNQICHGFCWFSKIQKTCDGTIFQGLNGYASGKCQQKTIKTRKAVRRRYRLWGWLHVHLGKEL